MQIHELNRYNGDTDSAYLAMDNGTDTGKVSGADFLSGVRSDVDQLNAYLNARIDNIIAGGTAPSAAEVTDARLGDGGGVYPSLGDAIRGQISEVKDALNYGTGNITIPLYGEKSCVVLSGPTVSMSDGKPVLVSSQLYNCYAMPCSANDYFVVSALGGADTRAWGFIDAAGNVLSVSGEYSNPNLLKLKAPENSAWIITHSRDESRSFTGKISLQTKTENLINEVREITTYRDLFNGFVHKGVFGTVVSDPNAVSIFVNIETNKYCRITAKGNMNRFIVYGVNNDVDATEVFRYTSYDVPNPAEYIYHNTMYESLLVVVYYGEDPTLWEGSCAIIESDSETLGQFAVNGIEVATKEQLDNQVENEGRHKVKFCTMNKQNEIENTLINNLYLIAVKSNNYYYSNSPDGTIPTAEGYLYLNEAEQKLYYSSCVYDRPKYLCDWDSAIADNEACQNYHCTITKDGDLIFFKRPYNSRTRSNPIIYEHTDYTSPHIIDFGADVKPFGFAIDNGVDHSYNGDFFMFAEYRGWAEEDNGTPLYVWKVVKPYNTKSCWTKVLEKEVRHFNYGPITGEEIGHYHTCNFDFYSGDWLVSTGDVGYQIKFFISSDNGSTWSNMNAPQTQASRTVGVIFVESGMYYQTDSTGVDHALYFVGRNNSGHIDFSKMEKVCDLSSTGAAGYGTALSREPYGLVFIDRMESGVEGETNLPLYFYDFKKDLLEKIIDTKAIDGYTTYDYEGRFGLPPLAFTHYQSPYEDGVVMGATTVTKPFLLNLVNNKKGLLVGVVKECVY